MLASARADLRGWATVGTGPFRFGPQPAATVQPLLLEPSPFGEWIAIARSDMRWDYLHFARMQAVLDRVTKGELKRVLFKVPIRHGKTEHNTIGYGAYRLEQTPSRARVIVATYNQDRADELSRMLRKLVDARGLAVTGRDTMRHWETAGGGSVRFLGAGAGTAGLNADVILVDDAIPKRALAESQIERNAVWDWLTSDLLGRCEPHTAVIFSMSHWHKDDPVGRIEDGRIGEWFVVDLPGVAEPNDPLGRAEGAFLWPELRGEDWHRQARLELLEYGYASLVQGRPRPREGGMFKWEWWGALGDVPRQGRMVRYWDLAGTEQRSDTHDPDFTAGVLMCRMVDERTTIVDTQRFRHSIAQRDAELERICRADRRQYGDRVTWWIETEAGIAGADRTAQVIRRLQAAGMAVYTEHPTGNKTLRAEPLASAAEARNVLLCPGDWCDPFRAEAADFPNGKHDDQIDAAAGAFSKLGHTPGEWGMSTFSYN